MKIGAPSQGPGQWRSAPRAAIPDPPSVAPLPATRPSTAGAPRPDEWFNICSPSPLITTRLLQLCSWARCLLPSFISPHRS
uniref:Uncharacterized protein n=1 Tax=Triticum urartu TaxID=4572 RepID=A0A8R7QBL9_TRIUA